MLEQRGKGSSATTIGTSVIGIALPVKAPLALFAMEMICHEIRGYFKG